MKSDTAGAVIACAIQLPPSWYGDTPSSAPAASSFAFARSSCAMATTRTDRLSCLAVSVT